MSRRSPHYLSALSDVYEASCLFIQTLLDVDLHSNSLLQYCPSDIFMGLIAASCALIKILNSSYAVHFNAAHGKAIFNAALLAIRSSTLKSNDRSDRQAEALARMWRAAESGLPRDRLTNEQIDPLDLGIRSRMSVSHVYDCVWGWRRTMSMSGVTRAADTSLIPAEYQSHTPSLPLQSEYEVGDMNGMSTLPDFDLLNSLGWTLKDATSFDFQ